MWRHHYEFKPWHEDRYNDILCDRQFLQDKGLVFGQDYNPPITMLDRPQYKGCQMYSTNTEMCNIQSSINPINTSTHNSINNLNNNNDQSQYETFVTENYANHQIHGNYPQDRQFPPQAQLLKNPKRYHMTDLDIVKPNGSRTLYTKTDDSKLQKMFRNRNQIVYVADECYPKPFYNDNIYPRSWVYGINKDITDESFLRMQNTYLTKDVICRRKYLTQKLPHPKLHGNTQSIYRPTLTKIK